MATFTNETKNISAVVNSADKTLSLGLWDSSIYPWQELLPWLFPSPGYPAFTNQTKN